MRLTANLLLEHIVPGDSPDDLADLYVLIEEARDVKVELEIDDIARFAIGVLHFAAIHPTFKEAILARLLDQDDERRQFARQVLSDAVAELDHA